MADPRKVAGVLLLLGEAVSLKKFPNGLPLSVEVVVVVLGRRIRRTFLPSGRTYTSLICGELLLLVVVVVADDVVFVASFLLFASSGFRETTFFMRRTFFPSGRM